MGDQLALFIDLKTVAIWAEEHFFDLELDRLMEYLQRRGAVVVKRAYGDWGRFDRCCGNTAGTSWALAPARSLTRCWSKRATSLCTWRPYSGQSPRPQSPCRRAWRLPTKVYSPRSSRRTWKESRDVLRDIGGVPLA